MRQGRSHAPKAEAAIGSTRRDLSIEGGDVATCRSRVVATVGVERGGRRRPSAVRLGACGAGRHAMSWSGGGGGSGGVVER